MTYVNLDILLVFLCHTPRRGLGDGILMTFEIVPASSYFVSSVALRTPFRATAELAFRKVHFRATGSADAVHCFDI